MAVSAATAQSISAPFASLTKIQTSWSAVARKARISPETFCGYVLRDEHTGKRIKMAPLHCAWHELADRQKRLILWSAIESGKTQQISIGRILWEIGRNPNLRACVLSNTHGQAAKIVRTVARYIESSEEYHEVFPDIKPWNPWTESAIIVDRKVRSKDYTLQASGVHGNIRGARIDLLVIDDILDYENTLTKAARDKTWDWLNAEIVGRLTENAKVIVIGNAHHPEDVMHRWARLWGPQSAYRYPVLGDDGRPRWPERWSFERIEMARQQMVPIEFARQLMCVARDEASSRFKREWIDAGLRRGEGKRLAYGLSRVPNGCKVYTGVDLAVQQHSAADLTSLFTILVHPDGSREVLAIESGRWAGPEIVERIFDAHRRYQSIVIVENNAAQDFIVQFTRHKYAFPIRGFTTGRNKAHPEFGVEQMAAEMAGGKWVIPNEGGKCHPEVDAWIQEMLFYDPRTHTGDRLMACIAPGHRVTTARGLVPIEEVQKGDSVLTHKARWRTVTGVTYRSWAGSAVCLKPRGMRPLVMTPEHPVWSAEACFYRPDRSNRLVPKDGTWDFRDAADLRSGRKLSGDFLLAPAAAWEGVAPDLDADAAFLVGLYLAEGWTSDHQASFAFHQREQYLVEFVRRQALRLWGARTSEYRKDGHNGVTACVQSVKATRFFSQFGKRENKALPWAWMSIPEKLGLLIARGWLMGDGSISTSARGNRHLRGVSVSRALIYQMQQFMWRSGLLPSVCVFNQPSTFRGKPCGHLPAELLSLSESDSATLLVPMLPEELERWGGGWRSRQRTNTCAVPVLNGAAIRIASAERFSYDGLVYNLHVDEDESFVCEGIAVHNSWFAKEGARMGSQKLEVGNLDLMSRG